MSKVYKIKAMRHFKKNIKITINIKLAYIKFYNIGYLLIY